MTYAAIRNKLNNKFFAAKGQNDDVTWADEPRLFPDNDEILAKVIAHIPGGTPENYIIDYIEAIPAKKNSKPVKLTLG